MTRCLYKWAATMAACVTAGPPSKTSRIRTRQRHEVPTCWRREPRRLGGLTVARQKGGVAMKANSELPVVRVGLGFQEVMVLPTTLCPWVLVPRYQHQAERQHIRATTCAPWRDAKGQTKHMDVSFTHQQYFSPSVDKPGVLVMGLRALGHGAGDIGDEGTGATGTRGKAPRAFISSDLSLSWHFQCDWSSPEHRPMPRAFGTLLVFLLTQSQESACLHDAHGLPCRGLQRTT